MSKNLNWLIVELERHGADRLSPEETRGLVEEVKAHVAEGIRARIDLGMNQEQAERETVEAFGDPEKVVREIARAGKKESGFIFERGVTASGGPVLIAGFGSIRVKGMAKRGGDGV